MSRAIKNIKRKIELISQKKQDRAFLKEVAQRMADLIKKRTKLGKGSNGKPLAKLKPSTIKRRKSFKKLHSSTTPSKSNLTMTGKMLDSIRGRASGNNTAQVYFSNDRAEKLEEYAREGSENREKRAFMDLTDSEQNNIERFIRGKILNRVRRILR